MPSILPGANGATDFATVRPPPPAAQTRALTLPGRCRAGDARSACSGTLLSAARGRSALRAAANAHSENESGSSEAVRPHLGTVLSGRTLREAAKWSRKPAPPRPGRSQGSQNAAQPLRRRAQPLRRGAQSARKSAQPVRGRSQSPRIRAQSPRKHAPWLRNVAPRRRDGGPGRPEPRPVTPKRGSAKSRTHPVHEPRPQTDRARHWQESRSPRPGSPSASSTRLSVRLFKRSGKPPPIGLSPRTAPAHRVGPIEHASRNLPSCREYDRSGERPCFPKGGHFDVHRPLHAVPVCSLFVHHSR